MKNETQRHLMLAVIVAIFWGLVGSILIGGDDEQGQEDMYCQMVADGLWPAYRKGEVNCDNE
jgi:hypothetical protein